MGHFGLDLDEQISSCSIISATRPLLITKEAPTPKAYQTKYTPDQVLFCLSSVLKIISYFVTFFLAPVFHFKAVTCDTFSKQVLSQGGDLLSLVLYANKVQIKSY